MKDLEVRGLEVIANTPKGYAFLKMQVVSWDPPCQRGPNEWFILLLPDAITEVMKRATIAGLTWEASRKAITRR